MLGGKKPYFLKKSEQKKLELVAKYEELKKVRFVPGSAALPHTSLVLPPSKSLILRFRFLSPSSFIQSGQQAGQVHGEAAQEERVKGPPLRALGAERGGGVLGACVCCSAVGAEGGCNEVPDRPCCPSRDRFWLPSFRALEEQVPGKAAWT